jgi:type VI protein secretion system component VasK
MHPRASSWLCGIATSALLLYVSTSGVIASARGSFAGFCDTAEQDCSQPAWTTTRILTWVLWGTAGLVLAATTVASYRTGARRAVYAGLGAAALMLVAAVALLQTFL